MKILVLGATGRSGRIFIAAALKQGHDIRAFVRSAAKDDRLVGVDVFEGDVQTAPDLKRAAAGCDAVVSLLGHKSGTPPRLQTTVMKQLASVLGEQQGRVISLTGSGVRLPGDKVRLFDYPITWMLKLIAHDRIQDGIDHVQTLVDSNLDWTVIRVSTLTNGKPHVYQLLEHGPVQLTTSRSTVASAILEVLEQHSFSHTAPMIGK